MSKNFDEGQGSEDRTRVIGEEKRSGRLVGVAETSKERAEWRRLQRKNLYRTFRKGKSGLSATERAVGKNTGAAFAKRKRNRAVCPKHQIMGGESQGGREPHLGERGGSEREHQEKKVNYAMKEGRFHEGKGGQARRASLEQVEGNMSG